MEMDSYPKNLVDQYLKVCSKLKKIEKAIFKRFRPNVSEVLEDYGRLAIKFEEAGIFQYAAMCQLGVGKCENYIENSMAECQAFLKAARLFLKAHEEMESLLLRSNRQEYRDTALHCFTQALEKSPDDSVIKAAIIREMQPHYEGSSSSSFDSPAHRIYELELATEQSVKNHDYLSALQQLDDIIDNIYERKKQNLYQEVLARAEIFRVLLLVALTLPPARQTPAHIKLIEFYTQLAEFQQEDDISPSRAQSPSKDVLQLYESWRPGLFLTQYQKYAMAEIMLAWHLSKPCELKVALQEFRHNFASLTETQRFLINSILEKVNRKC